jgi:hypothetical protein
VTRRCVGSICGGAEDCHRGNPDRLPVAMAPSRQCRTSNRDNRAFIVRVSIIVTNKAVRLPFGSARLPSGSPGWCTPAFHYVSVGILAMLWSALGCGPEPPPPPSITPDAGPADVSTDWNGDRSGNADASSDASIDISLDGGCGEPRCGPCRGPQDCNPGEQCNGGICWDGGLPPSTPEWRACTLDLDCTDGNHCKFGACNQECGKPTGCPAGLVCDRRGRCVVGEASTSPPPALPQPLAPALKVLENTLDFKNVATALPLTLTNTGLGDLEFESHSDQSWVTVSPAKGKLQPRFDLVVRVDAERAGGADSALLTILSNGGAKQIPIHIPPRLTGLFHGVLHITRPQDLGTRPFGVYLTEGGDGKLTGVVDDVASAAFMLPAAAVTGAVTRSDDGGQQAVTFTVSIPSPIGSKPNPSFCGNLART